MKKTLAVLAGIAAGVVLTASLVSTKKGKEIRNNLLEKANEIKRTMANNLEEKARVIHDSEVTYS